MVTQAVKAQFIGEGYSGDTETFDTGDEDSDPMDNNENKLVEGKFLSKCMLVL